MDDEINLLDYWRVIVKRKWLIIGLTLICAFSALIYSRMQPKMYKATATIMPVDTGGGGLASALIAMPFLGNVGGGGGEGKLIPILGSATLARQVAQDLDLKEYFPKLADNPNLDEEHKLICAVGSLKGAIEARRSGELLAVSVIWLEPEQAAKLANHYVDQLGKFLNMRSLNVNFQMIDPAVAPGRYFKPRIKKNVMLAGVLGLFMGVFIAFFWEYLENLPKTD